MINALVRPANPEDHQKLSSLIFYETHLHRHLDWRSPLEWLGDPYFWALDEGRQLSAALACPIEMDGIAWVRLFVFSGGWSAENAWDIIWAAARQEIAQKLEYAQGRLWLRMGDQANDPARGPWHPLRNRAAASTP